MSPEAEVVFMLVGTLVLFGWSADKMIRIRRITDYAPRSKWEAADV